MDIRQFFVTPQAELIRRAAAEAEQQARSDAWTRLSEAEQKKAWLPTLVSGSDEDKVSAWKMLSEANVSVSQKEILKQHLVVADFGCTEFTTKMVYGIAQDDLQMKWPKNKNMRSAILANLRLLRNDGYIKFERKGVYSIVKESAGGDDDEACDAQQPAPDALGALQMYESADSDEEAVPPAPHIIDDSESRRCEARICPRTRVQKNGCISIPDNLRCSNNKRRGCGKLCLKHRNLSNVGQLWMGLITAPRPDLYLPSNQPIHFKTPYKYHWN
jgi:hypothetical protein